MAMADFNRAILFDLFLASAYYNRAALQVQMGNRPQAISDYQRAAQYFLRDGNFPMHRQAQEQLRMLR
jgi:tetratricopeptide (TPR) repeat protein